MDSKKDLSLAISFYSDKASGQEVVSELINDFTKNGVNLELVLVDNAAKGRTPQIIENLKTKYPNIVRTIHLNKNIGFGGGTMTGMNLCKGEYVGYTCEDKQTSAYDTFRIFQKVKNGEADICKAKRVVREDGLIRSVLALGFDILVSLFFFRIFPDVNGYPIIMKRSTFKRLNIKSKNYMLNLEILLKAKDRNLKVSDIRVKFYKRSRGKSHVNFFTIFRFIKELIDLKRLYKRFK
jgi:glycosyltransferase involved in cell wall biosynthesis